MGKSKGKKNEDNTNDIDLLKDVASFASSIGLASASSVPSSGFDDSDFRKTGTIKKPQNPKVPKDSDAENKKGFEKKKTKSDGKFTNRKEFEKKKMNDDGKFKDKPRVPPVSISSKPFDRWKNLPKLPLVKASSLEVWYNDAADLEAKVIGSERRKSEVRNAEEWKSLVAKKKELAERLLAQYTQDFETSRGHSGDIKMLMATQHSGTAVDKVSAFAVLVGENPIANIRSLDALLGMITSKVGKRHALTGFEALKELFLSSLLPDRKLKSLFQRPLNELPESKDGYSLLLFWHWEECLKQRYERFVFALEEASRDMLPVLKEKALKTLYALLRSKSEQERRLLSALVNKLGDPENKSASNADYHLSNLLSDHPNMKAVVIDEVDSFLFRPHLGLKSKYHAVNFLSQIRLNHKGDGPKVAKRLVDVYFALFKILISEAGANSKIDANNKREDKKANGANNKIEDRKGNGSHRNKTEESPKESTMEMDSRLLSVLLTGVNRAFPFVASDEANDVIEVQTPMLFKLVHSTNFNVGVQALMLLDKISLKNQIVRDRFYRALYSKLLLPAAMNSSKAEMFIGLLLRAMKCDENLRRVAAFSKRILQVALQQPPQLACGCLFLLSEVLKVKPSAVREMVLQSEAIDDDLEHFEDIVEDTDKEPQTAPPKQLENAVGMNIMDADTDSFHSEDEDDFPASESEDEEFDGGDNMIKGDDLNVAGGLKTVANYGKNHPQQSNQKSSLPGGYDPRHREPSYCNADRASWWELVVLASHVHPSVAKMATTLLKGVEIIYNGNPLTDLSLPAFLDKFMEKKPKANTWHGGSQIEPMKKLDTNNHLLGADILSLAEEDVAPEDFVFHKFYMNKMNSSKKPKKKKKKKKGAEEEAIEEIFGVDADDDGPDEIGGDESDNDEIENMLDNGGVPMDTEGEYDYDDLDEMADEDDEGLLGDGSDAESDLPSDIAEEDDIDDSAAEVEEAEDEDEDEDSGSKKRKRKGKAGGKKAGASPFASLEDYDHLLNDAEDNESTVQKKFSSGKKKMNDEEGDEFTGKKKKKKSSSSKKKMNDEEGDESIGKKKKSSSRKKRKKSD